MAKQRGSLTSDPEVTVLSKVTRGLDTLAAPAQKRVICYLMTRYLKCTRGEPLTVNVGEIANDVLPLAAHSE